MEINIRDAIIYPFKPDSWVLELTKGGALVLASFLVLPIPFVVGYIARVVRKTAKGQADPPRLTDWVNLYKDGIKAILLLISYFALVAIPTFLFMTMESMINIFILGIMFIFYFLWGYSLLAGLTTFAVNGRFKDGFNFEEIRMLISSSEFLIAFLLLYGIQLAISLGYSLISAPIMALTFGLGAVVLFPVGFMVNFYQFMVIGNLFGQAYSAAINQEADP